MQSDARYALSQLGATLDDMEMLERRERQFVLEARYSGASWDDVGRVYGISRQAAHARWARTEKEEHAKHQ